MSVKEAAHGDAPQNQSGRWIIGIGSLILFALIGLAGYRFTAANPGPAFASVVNRMMMLACGSLIGGAVGLGLYGKSQARLRALTAQHAADQYALEQERDQMRAIVRGVAARLAEEQEQKLRILAAMGQGLIGLNAQGAIQLVNAAAERLLGWTEAELLGQPLHDRLHLPRGSEAICVPEKCVLLATLQGQVTPHETYDTFLCKGARQLPVAYRCAPVWRGEEFAGALIVFEDISERLIAARALDEYGERVAEQNEQLQDYCAELQTTQAELEAHARALTETNAQVLAANAALERLATTDGMTGLANHRAFQEQLRSLWVSEAETQASLPLSVLLIDVDHFKQYNDTYGHPAGDAVLRVVAKRMLAQVRASDLVARYGGEEFAILLPQTGGREAYRIAERLRASIAEQPFADTGASVTISLGAATVEKGRKNAIGFETPDEVIAAADRALYRAKRAGRNRICTVPPLPEEAEDTPRAA